MSDEQPKTPNAYDVVISDLEAERDRLASIVSALKRIRSLGVHFDATKGFMVHETNTPAHVAQNIPHDAFFGMTIPDAARKYLSWGGNRQTKSTPDLCEALKEGGFQTTAANFRESVRSTLSRHADFVKIKGQWGLREWYGNRGIKRSKRSETPGASTPEGTSEPSPELKVEEA